MLQKYLFLVYLNVTYALHMTIHLKIHLNSSEIYVNKEVEKKYSTICHIR